jgi:PAS domain S-box-containing protein
MATTADTASTLARLASRRSPRIGVYAADGEQRDALVERFLAAEIAAQPLLNSNIACDGVVALLRPVLEYGTGEIRSLRDRFSGSPLLLLCPDSATAEHACLQSLGGRWDLMMWPAPVALVRHRLNQLGLVEAIPLAPSWSGAAELISRIAAAAGANTFEIEQVHGTRTPGPREVELFGREHRIHAEFLSRVHPEDLPGLREAERGALTGEAPMRADFRFLREDGQWRWLVAAGSAVMGADGRPRLVGLIWDETSRNSSEQELRRLTRHLELATEAAGIRTFEFDLRSGATPLHEDNWPMHAARVETINDALRVIVPEDRETVRAAIARAAESGERVSIDYRAFNRNGEVRWRQSTGQVIGRTANSPGRLMGTTQDITLRVAREAELRELGLRLSATLDAAGMNPWGWDLKRNRRLPGPRDEQLFGEVISSQEQMLERVHPDDRHIIELLGDPERLARLGEFSRELRIRAADGKLRWFAVFVRLLKDVNGVPEEIVGVTWDIHARKQAEIAVEDLARRLGEALDAAGMLSWEWDLETGNRQAFGRQEEILGIAPDSIRGVRSLIHPDDISAHDAAIDRALSGDSDYYNEFRIIKPDGQVRWIMSIGSPQRAADGHLLRLRGVALDITERRETERALRESQERLRRALDAAGMIAWEWDLVTGERRSFGDDEHVLGAHPTTGSEAVAMMHPEDRIHDSAIFDAAVKNATDYRNEFRITGRDGRERWLLSSGSPVEVRDGAIRLFAGVAWDITERKYTEAALAEAQDRLARALDAARMVVWEWEVATGVRRSVGRDELLLGCHPTTAEEVNSIIHPDDFADDHVLFERTLRGEGEYENEFRVIWPDGSEHWIHSRGKPVERADGKGIGTVIGVAWDVTDRRFAESALAESERLQRLAAEAARLNFWQIDLRTGRRSGGPRDLEFFGHPLESLEHGRSVIHPDDWERIHESLEETKRNGEPVSIEYRALRPDGSARWLRMTGQCVFTSQGLPHGIVGVTQDIHLERTRSEQLAKALQEARAASEAKSGFLANMSHEIRTPMNAVLGCTTLLLRSELDSSQRRLAETLRTSGEMLLAQINDILDFSKIEAGEMVLEVAPFSPLECAENAMEMVAAQANAKRLALVCVSRGVVNGRVLGDATRLSQVLVNLLANAVKFTEQGQVELVLELQERAGHPTLVAQVRDTGIGMSEDVQANLFQAFRQGDPSTTRRFGGTGLGLAISQRLCRMMGGSLSVNSRVGEGSTFTLRLPLRWSAEPNGDEQNLLSGQCVVLSVDRAAVAAALTTQLRYWGAQVELLATLPAASQAALLQGSQAWILDDLAWTRLQQRKEGIQPESSPGPRRLLFEPLVSEQRSARTQEGIELFPLALPVKPTELLSALLPSDGESRPAGEAVDNTRPGESQPLTILLAEDNAVNQTLALMMLEVLGYKADCVANGLEVIDALRRTPYDVVLMDVEMPQMDGLQASRAIRGLVRHRARPWIIAVTAHVLPESRARIEAAGMNDYVSKPMGPDELRAALGRAWEALYGRDRVMF